MQAARETGERTEERGMEVPETDVTLSLKHKENLKAYLLSH